MSRIINSHREQLEKISRELPQKGKELSAILSGQEYVQRLIKHFDAEAIRKDFEANRNEEGPHISYPRAIRNHLQAEPIGLKYNDAIEVLRMIFGSLFTEKRYDYLKAVRAFQEYSQEDPVSAQAQWRAYFEHRFWKPILRFLEEYGQQITLNFALWSFSLRRTLPVYRLHANVSEKKESGEEESLYSRREKAFRTLGAFQGDYSFVWEYVHNNVQTIFYFDKSVEEPTKMTIYEIDPDAEKASGLSDIQYYRKCEIDASHREDITLLNLEDPTSKIFQKTRAKDPKEREYQYEIMRFLIRSGIFNPRDAAYRAQKGVPAYRDLLKGSGDQLSTLRKRLQNGELKEEDTQRDKEMNEEKDAQWALFEKYLEGRDSAELIKVYEEQYNVSWDTRKGGMAFSHADAFGEENEQLDRLIAFIDLTDADVINNRLAVFEAGFFFLTQFEKNTISHIYWLPIVTNWRERKTGGSIFINSDKRIGTFEGTIGKTTIPPQVLLTILYYFTGLFDDKQIEEIEADVRPAQERAAAVSIMSRNISHNIGSHVLSYLKSLLSNEQRILENGVLENLVKKGTDGRWKFNEGILLEDPLKKAKALFGRLFPNQPSALEYSKLKRVLKFEDGLWAWNEDIIKGNYINSEKLAAPFLRSIGHLLGYFQERQDYIGVLATDWHLYYGTAHFKEQVLDHFYGRHHFTSADGQNVDTSHNLILDFIAYSESYEEGDIIIEAKWRDKDGEEQLLLSNEKGTQPDKGMKKQKDIEIALPAGNTGRQAIFTILENCIRNTAKHGVAKAQRKEDKIKFELILSEDKKYPDLYKMEVTYNDGGEVREVDEGVVKRIQEVFSEDLVDINGRPNEKQKGIKEIQIAAAWLRGIGPDQLWEKNNGGLSPNILEINDLGKKLQYVFWLQKPKPGLLVVPDKTKYKKKRQWRPAYQALEGWDIAELSGKRLRNTNPNKKPYRFVVVHESLSDEKRMAFIKSHNPVRVMGGYTEEELRKGLPIENLYKRWLDDEGKAYFAWALIQDRHPSPVLASEVPVLIEDNKGPNLAKAEGIAKGVGELTAQIVEENGKVIAFRDHHYTPVNLKEFQEHYAESFPQKFAFIEGISGANSTNRLLREENLDEQWALKMREAALTKVLIVDERLWDNLYQVHASPKSGRKPQNTTITVLEHLAYKNVYVYSMMPKEGAFQVINHKNEPILEWHADGRQEWLEGHKREQFHFVCLHQGLLDRLLNHLRPQLAGRGFDNEEAQLEKIFNRFKEIFPASLRHLIHSGRSKTHALPPDVAFMQLSSIDTALNDCKFTLCELLFASMIEKTAKK